MSSCRLSYRCLEQVLLAGVTGLVILRSTFCATGRHVVTYGRLHVLLQQVCMKKAVVLPAS